MGDPATLSPIPNKLWPLTQCRPDAVQITMTAGYALGTDDSYETPDILRLGVQSMVREYWNRRNITVNTPPQQVAEPPSVHVKDLLAPYVRTVRAPGSVEIRP